MGPHVCLEGAGPCVRLAAQVAQIHLQISCRALEGRPVRDQDVRGGVVTQKLGHATAVSQDAFLWVVKNPCSFVHRGGGDAVELVAGYV